MDNTPQWSQGGIVINKNAIINPESKKPRPQKEQALNCPRCASTNTKFCYYNNYSLSQPRYFCKTCRRYWTDGGSLRSVPVGGGSRKNRRSSSSGPSSSSSSSNSKKLFTSDPQFFSQNQNQNPKIHQSQDLNLAYNPPAISEFASLSFPNSVGSTQHFPFFSSLMAAESNSVYSQAGFPEFKPEFKPSLGFSVDNYGNNNNNNIDHGVNSTRVSVSFPFDELNKQDSAHFAEERETADRNNSNAYWNGMIAGGSW